MKYDTVLFVTTHGNYDVSKGTIPIYRIDAEGVHSPDIKGADPLRVKVLEVPLGGSFTPSLPAHLPETKEAFVNYFSERIASQGAHLKLTPLRKMLKMHVDDAFRARAFQNQRTVPYAYLKEYSVDISSKDPLHEVIENGHVKEEGVRVVYSSIPKLHGKDLFRAAARNRTTRRSHPWRSASRTAVLKKAYDMGARNVLLIDLACSVDFGEHTARGTRALRRTMRNL
jgi:hypothetical protein